MTGASGVPKRRECLRIIALVLVQRPRTKRISCKGQGAVHSVYDTDTYIFKAKTYSKHRLNVFAAETGDSEARDTDCGGGGEWG